MPEKARNFPCDIWLLSFEPGLKSEHYLCCQVQAGPAGWVGAMPAGQYRPVPRAASEKATQLLAVNKFATVIKVVKSKRFSSHNAEQLRVRTVIK
jgi:hypothetical protein